MITKDLQGGKLKELKNIKKYKYYKCTQEARLKVDTE